MRFIDLKRTPCDPITLFDSVRAASREFAIGNGDVHMHLVRFEAGGEIGEHPTGFAQLLLVIEGSGWAAGSDGRKVDLESGEGVIFDRDEMHSKGSDSGMTALMIQVTDIADASREP